MTAKTKTELKVDVDKGILTKQLMYDIIDSTTMGYLNKGQNILFLFAHPDDEQYMAGTIQQLITSGQEVYVAYTTSGKNGTDVTGTYPTGSDELGLAREQEAANSLTSLGVDLYKIYALRRDDDSLIINTLLSSLASVLSNDGIVVDAIITFDRVGVYGNQDHAACQRVGLEYFRLTDTTKAIFFFTVPESDIDEENLTDITLGNATDDKFVDFIHILSTAQNNAKKSVLDFHVTQYEDPFKSSIKSHYTNRPYEYICTGNAKIRGLGEDPLQYLYSIYRQ